MKTISTMPDPSIDARLSALRAAPQRVDRTAHVIYGVAIIQAGPLNEGDSRPWDVDATALAQVLSLMLANGAKGTKARWTHPNMSSDGLGKFLGRWKHPRMSADGSTVLADLHLASIAFRDGDSSRGKYVEDLAADDPESFGVSLYPVLDRPAMEKTESNGRQLMRFAKIIAGDVVDEPAATRGGFFGGQELSIASAPAYAKAALDELFPDASEDVIRARVNSYLDTYLATRPASTPTPADDPALRLAKAKEEWERLTAPAREKVNAMMQAEIAKNQLNHVTEKVETMTSTLAAPLAGGIELASFTGDEAASFESVREYANEYLSHVKIHTDAKLDLASYVCGRLKDERRPVTPAMASALAKQSTLVESHFPLLSAESWKVAGLKD